MCLPLRSEFFLDVRSWSGEVYWKSSTLGPLPHRTCWKCSTTARGCTSRRSWDERSGRVAERPEASGGLQPRTPSNHATASATFGTVVSTSSMPSSPGTVVLVESRPLRLGDQSGRLGSLS